MYSISIGIHYIGGGQAPNHEELHCFKWEFRTRLVQRFSEHNPGIK